VKDHAVTHGHLRVTGVGCRMRGVDIAIEV